MTDPFAVAVGMVLQRNLIPMPKCRDRMFNALCGRFMTITGIEDTFVYVTVEGINNVEVDRHLITAEWFIPD